MTTPSAPDADTPPARGTRPRNRRELIVAAASELFADRGYADVSMSDVARAVNVQPSALYRHFAGKQDLLREVVARGTRLRHEAVVRHGGGGVGPLLDALADSALESRSSTRLWSVEVRNVDPSALDGLREEVRALPDALAERLVAERPDMDPEHAQLRAWAALDVLASISFHDEPLPDRQARSLLARMMSRIVELPDLTVAPTSEATTEHTTLSHPSRRERVLASATRLFAVRGYGAVRLEDIAADAGVSTAGLYTYVDGKANLLEAAVTRAAESLAQLHASVFAGVDAPDDALEALVTAYVRSCWTHSAQHALLLTEVRHLPERARTGVRQTLDDVDLAWTATLQQLRSDLDASTARIQVRAAQMIAQDVLATPRLRSLPGARAFVRAAVRVVLDAPEPPGEKEK